MVIEIIFTIYVAMLGFIGVHVIMRMIKLWRNRNYVHEEF